MINSNEFKRKWGFLADKKVYIACSGGVDSMLLAQLFSKFCINITILHVNYHLRDEESNLDEKFVKDFCSNLNLNFDCLSINMNEFLKLNGGNLQEQARKIRYNWFSKFITNSNSYLILGHHFDDQIETFYQNLSRKSGILGLACMLEKRENILRPLLSFTKEEIILFSKQNSYTWREDKSNLSLKYTRNKFRNEFLPFLFNQIPTLKDSISILIKVFQDNQFEIEKFIEPICKKIKNEKILPIKIYEELSIEQKIVLLKHFCFSSKQLKEVEKLIFAQKGKYLISKTHRITKESKFLSFSLLNSKVNSPTFTIEKTTSLPKTFNLKEIYLDVAKIKGTLKIRKWEIGDKISPIGMKGSKLISDIITESKILNTNRNDIFVLVDDENIHWCLGLKIGRKAIANSASEKIILVRIN